MPRLKLMIFAMLLCGISCWGCGSAEPAKGPTPKPDAAPKSVTAPPTKTPNN